MGGGCFGTVDVGAAVVVAAGSAVVAEGAVSGVEFDGRLSMTQPVATRRQKAQRR
jgi:hypothetical protein